VAHHLIYLPAVQLVLLQSLRRERTTAWMAAGGVLLAGSIVASSSVLLLEYFGDWGEYSLRGLPLLANACVFALGVSVLLRAGVPALRAARR
jgi:hypothetical protein